MCFHLLDRLLLKTIKVILLLAMGLLLMYMRYVTGLTVITVTLLFIGLIINRYI